jgi:hypothetical protein
VQKSLVCSGGGANSCSGAAGTYVGKRQAAVAGSGDGGDSVTAIVSYCGLDGIAVLDRREISVGAEDLLASKLYW